MPSLRPISVFAPVMFAFALSGGSLGQIAPTPQSSFATGGANVRDFTVASVTSRLSPDLALAAYERGLKAQSEELTAYTALTLIDAAARLCAKGRVRAEASLCRAFHTRVHARALLWRQVCKEQCDCSPVAV